MSESEDPPGPLAGHRPRIGICSPETLDQIKTLFEPHELERLIAYARLMAATQMYTDDVEKPKRGRKPQHEHALPDGAVQHPRDMPGDSSDRS